jgi:hypothetical protein
VKKKTSEPSFLKLARPGARRRSKAWKIVPLTTLLIFGGIFFWSGFEVERVKESKTSSEKGENKALLLRVKKKKKQPNGKKKDRKNTLASLSAFRSGIPICRTQSLCHY